MAEKRKRGPSAGVRTDVVSSLGGLSKEEKRKRLEEACAAGDPDVLRGLRALRRRMDGPGEGEPPGDRGDDKDAGASDSMTCPAP